MPLYRPIHRLILGCTLSATLLYPAQAMAMRCGNALINEGDSQEKVLRYCGEPANKSRRYAMRPGIYPDRDSGLSVNGEQKIGSDRYYPYGRSEVLVEEWVYNFGPNKLMRQVRFADGIVEDVKTLDYGYRNDD